MTQYAERDALEIKLTRAKGALSDLLYALERSHADLTDYPESLPDLYEIVHGLAGARLTFPDKQLSHDQCCRISSEMALAAMGDQRGPVKQISTNLKENGECIFGMHFSDDTTQIIIIGIAGEIRDCYDPSVM